MEVPLSICELEQLKPNNAKRIQALGRSHGVSRLKRRQCASQQLLGQGEITQSLAMTREFPLQSRGQQRLRPKRRACRDLLRNGQMRSSRRGIAQIESKSNELEAQNRLVGFPKAPT
ncbi:hypothetical protein [Neoroseomonas rubea]|uniref:hypothetical protein n=1 Tax=Neoroseomonas rubea TaxID=2748666 RepID=UPI0018DF92AA|nr:hypothetical protein [Roseomonas rubea]